MFQGGSPSPFGCPDQPRVKSNVHGIAAWFKAHDAKPKFDDSESNKNGAGRQDELRNEVAYRSSCYRSHRKPDSILWPRYSLVSFREHTSRKLRYQLTTNQVKGQFCPLFRSLLGVTRTFLDMDAMSPNDPGCVKTHTSEKCRKYNSPTQLRAARAQYDLTPALVNFAEMLLRPYRAPEFSTQPRPKETSGGVLCCSSETVFDPYQSTNFPTNIGGVDASLGISYSLSLS